MHSPRRGATPQAVELPSGLGKRGGAYSPFGGSERRSSSRLGSSSEAYRDQRIETGVSRSLHRVAQRTEMKRAALRATRLVWSRPGGYVASLLLDRRWTCSVNGPPTSICAPRSDLENASLLLLVNCRLLIVNRQATQRLPCELQRLVACGDLSRRLGFADRFQQLTDERPLLQAELFH